MRGPFLLGRMLFGGYFIMSGINHFKQTNQLAQYAGSKGVPRPDAAVRATGAVLIAGGASILLGIKPKLGAAAIVGFLAGVSPIMHDFWNENSEQRMNDMINFTKNLALVGGATALMGRGAVACEPGAATDCASACAKNATREHCGLKPVHGTGEDAVLKPFVY